MRRDLCPSFFLISNPDRRERWKNGNARFAAIFTIPKTEILTVISLQGHPFINFLTAGSAQCAALPKTCLKRNNATFGFSRFLWTSGLVEPFCSPSQRRGSGDFTLHHSSHLMGQPSREEDCVHVKADEGPESSLP